MVLKQPGFQVCLPVHFLIIDQFIEFPKINLVTGGGVQVLSLNTERNVAFDRPFLFFIRDTKVGGFLFEGIIVSPDEAESGEETFQRY